MFSAVPIHLPPRRQVEDASRMQRIGIIFEGVQNPNECCFKLIALLAEYLPTSWSRNSDADLWTTHCFQLSPHHWLLQNHSIQHTDCDPNRTDFPLKHCLKFVQPFFCQVSQTAFENGTHDVGDRDPPRLQPRRRTYRTLSRINRRSLHQTPIN